VARYGWLTDIHLDFLWPAHRRRGLSQPGNAVGCGNL